MILQLFKNSVQKNEYDPLAQAVEHLTFNQGVRSSILRWVTKKSDAFASDFFI